MAGKINLTDELKKYFGFNKFKGNQEAIIQNLLSGKDTFVLMPDRKSTRLNSSHTRPSRMPYSA